MSPDHRPRLDVAIIGSGPAAFYAAAELNRQNQAVAHVRMIERLPTPGGLARAGVAPDHAERREIIGAYEKIARSQGRFTFHGNVQVGRDVHLAELLTHHHAVIYATGAAGSRTLDIPGAQLAGCFGANAFVGWYNGHPDWAHLEVPLDCERAIVVGNGNVALDIARLLVKSPAELRQSDMANHARAALAHSRIREVLVLGRRGAADASFTHPELLELGALENADVVLEAGDIDDTAWTQSYASLLRRETLHRYTQNVSSNEKKQIKLLFNTQITNIQGTSNIEQVALLRTPASADQAQASVVCAGLVIHAIGYRGQAQDGLPFEPQSATIPNHAGRVLRDQAAMPGCYVTGWIKRGPRGVIGSNKLCARETVNSLLEDFQAGRLTAPRYAAENFTALLHARQPQSVDYRDWKILDRYEQAQAAPGSPREKLTNVAEMLDVIGRASTRSSAA